MRIAPVLFSLSLGATLAFAQPSVTAVAVPGALSNVLGCGSASGSNCSSTVNQPISPGSLISIFGSSLASALSVADTVTLSTTLADVSSVQINGSPATIAFVSPSQINVQAPWELDPTAGKVSLVVTNGLGASQSVSVPIVAYSPAIVNLNLSTPRALVTNADGSLNGPSGSIPGVSTNPATAGDTIVIYATGLGPVSPSPVDGAASFDQPRNTNAMPVVMIGGMSAQVVSSALSPQSVGVYAVSVVVPQGVSTGPSVPLQIQIGGVSSANLATVTLH